MVLSRRERLIAVVTILVMMIFILDRYAVTPFMEAKENISIEKQGLMNDMRNAEKIFRHRNRIKDEWQEMIRGGLGSDPSGMESMVLHEIRQWSYDCGLSISSIKPDRNRSEGMILKEIIFNVACRGSMNSVGQFLWQVENSQLPLRITEFQLGAREENGGDMSLQLKLSTVYLPENESPEKAAMDKGLSGGKG